MANVAPIDLRPIPMTTRPLRRLPQLTGGLVLYGVSMGLMIRGGLGLDPWDVLHQALSGLTGLTFGTITAITGALVLLCWIPLRQRPGLGTIANIVVIAVAVDATLALLGPAHAMAWRIALMVGGVVLNGLATAAYIGVRLRPGPRGGPMTRLLARPRGAGRGVRTRIQLTRLAPRRLLRRPGGVRT